MKALLLIAHGSRKSSSNEEVAILAAKLKATINDDKDDNNEDDFSIVMACFLELAHPLIPEGLDQCVLLGASEIYVVPYFLSAGRHVVKDVPGEISVWQDQNPNINVYQKPYVGSSNMMLSLIKDSLNC